ncbi:MAG: hypothetical protein CEN87_627 [Parcubacteria group bacterium Licking1014_1]|nr:MAG: hypothetical protein CEN87_627 [Parcubacteria group bacterium Licking1014_1]
MGKIKRIADGEEAVVRVPPVLKIVDVQVALAGITPEFGHITIAGNRVDPHGNMQSIICATAP